MANEEVRIANIETVLKVSASLFIEHGIQNTTREMIARASGLSRRSTERYFPSMTDCVVQAAEYIGKEIYKKFRAVQMLESNQYTADQILEVYLEDMKQLLLEEPRLFACYAEFKAYLYRNSPNSERDYITFGHAIGCRSTLEKIFELGKKDRTVLAHYSPENNASYLVNTIASYFSNVVLVYSRQPEVMKEHVERYTKDTLGIYCHKNKEALSTKI
jgi:AcrR family transcriptional regulator